MSELHLFKRALALDGKTITLQERNIIPPLHDSPDFDVHYTDNNDVQALVCTEQGKTYFDGVSTELPITHTIKFEFIEGVTAETWILFRGRRIDILDVINCDENDQILICSCTDKGLATQSGASGSLADVPTEGEISLVASST